MDGSSNGPSLNSIDYSRNSGSFANHDSIHAPLDYSEAPNSNDDNDGQDTFESDGKHHNGKHHLIYMTAGQHNSIWVSWSHGRVDKYQANGKLVARKVLLS